MKMKRKLLVITLAAALLAAVYTIFAYLSTRGLQIYLMGTRKGAVLAGTWQIALLADILLWIPGAAALIRKIKGRRKAPGVKERMEASAPNTQDPTEQPEKGETEETELLEQRRGETEETELLEPRRGETEETELLEPRKGEAEETELLEPRRGETEETELLEPRRGETEETVLLEPCAGDDDETTVPEPEKSEPEKPQPERPAAKAAGKGTVQFCPNCGAPVTGKKFCPKCGTKTGN